MLIGRNRTRFFAWIVVFLSLLVPGGRAPVAAAEPVVAPIAGLRIDAVSPVPVGMTTTLTAVVDAGTGLTYRWNLGDGTVATGTQVTHTYALPGRYLVSVVATNALGTAMAEAIVSVEAPTSVDLVQFGKAPESHFWGLWAGAMLAISVACLCGLAIMWRRGWLFPPRRR